MMIAMIVMMIAMNVVIIIPNHRVGHGDLLHQILVIVVAAKADVIRLNANTILVEDPNDDNYDDRDDSDDDRDECSDYHTQSPGWPWRSPPPNPCH